MIVRIEFGFDAEWNSVDDAAQWAASLAQSIRNRWMQTPPILPNDPITIRSRNIAIVDPPKP